MISLLDLDDNMIRLIFDFISLYNGSARIVCKRIKYEMMKKSDIIIDGFDCKRMKDMIKGINLSCVKNLRLAFVNTRTFELIWSNLVFENVRVISFVECESYACYCVLNSIGKNVDEIHFEKCYNLGPNCDVGELVYNSNFLRLKMVRFVKCDFGREWMEYFVDKLGNRFGTCVEMINSVKKMVVVNRNCSVNFSVNFGEMDDVRQNNYLWGIKVKNINEIIYLDNLVGLINLCVVGGLMGDESLGILERCVNLEELEFRSYVKIESMDFILCLKELRVLRFVNVVGMSFKSFEGLNFGDRLEEFTIQLRWEERGICEGINFGFLSGCTQLRKLNICGIGRINNLRLGSNLEELNFVQSRIDDDMWNKIGHLIKLKSLGLECCANAGSMEGVENAFKNATGRIEKLNVKYCWWLNTHLMNVIAKEMKTLKHLSLGFDTIQIMNYDMCEIVGTIKNLEYLYVGKINWNDDVVDMLNGLRCLKQFVCKCDNEKFIELLSSYVNVEYY